MNIFV